MRLNQAFALTIVAGLLSLFGVANSATHGRTLTKAEAANLFGGDNPARDCGLVSGCANSLTGCNNYNNDQDTCNAQTVDVKIANTNGKSCNTVDATKTSCNDSFANQDCSEKHRCQYSGYDKMCKQVEGAYAYTRAPSDCKAQ